MYEFNLNSTINHCNTQQNNTDRSLSAYILLSIFYDIVLILILYL